MSSEEQASTGMVVKGTQSTVLRNGPVMRRPFPHTPSPASPLLKEKVLPMCPVRSVTYVSGRSSNGCELRVEKTDSQSAHKELQGARTGTLFHFMRSRSLSFGPLKSNCPTTLA